MAINTLHIGGEDVPVFTVAHITDWSLDKRPVVLARQYHRTLDEAETAARNASTTVPAPQRFTVYCPDLLYVSSWQAGKHVPAFSVSGARKVLSPRPISARL